MKEYLLLEELTEDIVIIKINKSYYTRISKQELYDVTRGCWKRRIESVEKAEYAFSVFYGRIVEVYKIDRWVPSEKMERKTKPYDEKLDGGRIAFFGEIADENIRRKYIGKYVNRLYKKGEANPVKVILRK